MPASINIIARTNGVGLDRDVDLIHGTLAAAGFHVTVSHCRGISPLRSILPGKPRFDANIFLERVFPRWFGSAKTNLLVPNQERFPHRHLKHLRHISHILCKSRHAEEIFSKLGHSTRFTSFTSTDLDDPAIQPDYQSFFHLAGRQTTSRFSTSPDAAPSRAPKPSSTSGTNTRNGRSSPSSSARKTPPAPSPPTPQLTLVQCKENAPSSVPANVRLITDYIPHSEIKTHLNTHGIHLCTSLSEGWGHYTS